MAEKGRAGFSQAGINPTKCGETISPAIATVNRKRQDGEVGEGEKEGETSKEKPILPEEARKTESMLKRRKTGEEISLVQSR